MTASEAVSAAVFYRVDGINFAFGLDWMTAAANKQSVAQAKLAAQRQNATHLAWRLAKAQVGLTRLQGDLPETSIISPWRSAAAAFADLPYSSLLAAFKFRDGKTWILAATNGRIYANGDRVFTEGDAARRYFDELFAQQYWNDIFAPADWQSRAKQIDPLAVLRRRRPEGRVLGLFDGLAAALGLVSRPGVPLQAMSERGLRKYSRVLITGATVAVIALTSTIYVKWHAAHRRRPVATLSEPYYPPVIPGGKTLASCVEQLPLLASRYQTPGWALSEVVCAGGQAEVTLFPEQNTPITSILAFHPDADLGSRKQAVITVPLHGEEETPLTLPLISEDKYRNAFVVIDEHANANNLTGPALPPGGSPPSMNGRPRPRPYRVSQWSFDTTAPPLLWVPDFASIPNLEVTSVALGISEHGLAWRIKGNAYVSP